MVEHNTERKEDLLLLNAITETRKTLTELLKVQGATTATEYRGKIWVLCNHLLLPCAFLVLYIRLNKATLLELV
jgi:hypothetical protein